MMTRKMFSFRTNLNVYPMP
jgi:hypothetical protein